MFNNKSNKDSSDKALVPGLEKKMNRTGLGHLATAESKKAMKDYGATSRGTGTNLQRLPRNVHIANNMSLEGFTHTQC